MDFDSLQRKKTRDGGGAPASFLPPYPSNVDSKRRIPPTSNKKDILNRIQNDATITYTDP